MLQPGGENGRACLKALAPQVAPAVANDRGIRRTSHDLLEEDAPLEVGAAKAAADIVGVVAVAPVA